MYNLISLTSQDMIQVFLCRREKIWIKRNKQQSMNQATKDTSKA